MVPGPGEGGVLKDTNALGLEVLCTQVSNRGRGPWGSGVHAVGAWSTVLIMLMSGVLRASRAHVFFDSGTHADGNSLCE